jgi:prepilin-type N-terminal cleavage/methylation domain-containing protein
MKKYEKGFTILEVLIVLVVVGVVGGASWYIWQSNNKDIDTVKPAATTAQNDQPADPSQESDRKTIDGITYSTPSGWTNATGPFKADKTGSGHYLRSPDYTETGKGQLAIKAGAYIDFKKLEWAEINANTTLEQAVDIVKNGQGGYFDPGSVKLTMVDNKQVVIFNAGHTTDGVSIFHKTASGQWLEAGFTTTTGGDAEYNAPDSPHYTVFLRWLGQFIKLNP